MKTRFLMACVAATMICSSAGAAVKVGDKPQLRLRMLDNSVVTSQQMAGHIVILEFWATWCGPCVKQVPHLKELNAKYAPLGVRLISVSLDDNRGDAITFIRQNGMNWGHAMDNEQGGELSDVFGVSGIPHAFILSPEGEVLWRGHPASIDEPLKTAFEEHPPTSAGEPDSKQTLEAIDKATDLIDKEEDYAGAYEAIADLTPEGVKDRKVARKFRSLAMRFKPVGRRAEALKKFYEANPEAKERLAELGIQVEAPAASR